MPAIDQLHEMVLDAQAGAPLDVSAGLALLPQIVADHPDLRGYVAVGVKLMLAADLALAMAGTGLGAVLVIEDPEPYRAAYDLLCSSPYRLTESSALTALFEWDSPEGGCFIRLVLERDGDG